MYFLFTSGPFEEAREGGRASEGVYPTLAAAKAALDMPVHWTAEIYVLGPAGPGAVRTLVPIWIYPSEGDDDGDLADSDGWVPLLSTGQPARAAAAPHVDVPRFEHGDVIRHRRAPWIAGVVQSIEYGPRGTAYRLSGGQLPEGTASIPVDEAELVVRYAELTS